MPIKRLLFISNGHGEDSIAAEIVRRLPAAIKVETYPTLGDGRAYNGICDIVGPRAQLASEGWRNTRGSIAEDIRGGGIATVWPGLRFIREARKPYDRVVVVGDMIGVYGCWVTGHTGITYLDVYKTGYGRSYLGIDKWILRRTARTVFCRAASLADTLQAAGIDARAAGNVMMDTIPRQRLQLERRRTRGLTILPGSRGHTVANFALQVDALAKLPPALLPDLFLAVASSVDLLDLSSASGLVPVGERLQGRGLDIALLAGKAMGDALDTSDLVLSQAGTATVQAIGLGKPAITFRSPEDRASRFEDESRLFGDARLAVAADADTIAAALAQLLSDPADLARRAAVGRQRIGGPGAIDAIIAELVNDPGPLLPLREKVARSAG